MAIYHLHVKNISRGEGRSAVAAAAYRAGETLPNVAEEGESRFGGRRDVLHSEICLPAAAPAWMADRGHLWNAVEAAERRKDARLAKEIEFALPRELAPAMWLTVARSMAAVYTASGHVVDLAIHEDGSGHNPHVHLLLTTRRIEKDGFGGKMREADGLKFVTEARSNWANIANAALAAAGAGVELEPRSHAAAGITTRPGQHRGPDQLERRARRAQRDQMGEQTMQDLRDQLTPSDEDRHPVPDPDGRPISPAEQNRAEEAMIAEMERPTEDVESADVPATAVQNPKADDPDWWQHASADRAESSDEPQATRKDDVRWWDDPSAPEAHDPLSPDEDARWDRGRA